MRRGDGSKERVKSRDEPLLDIHDFLADNSNRSFFRLRFRFVLIFISDCRRRVGTSGISCAVDDSDFTVVAEPVG